MTLVKVSGTITSNATEQNIFTTDPAGDRIYSCWINTHAMIAGDQIEVRVYQLDSQLSVMRVWQGPTVISGLQSEPSFYIHAIPTAQYRVTIKRIAGTDRAYSWTRWEVT